MFAGLILLFVGKTNTLKKLGIILLGFGLMFYGLEADEAMKPFRTYQPFIDLMQTQQSLLGQQLEQFYTHHSIFFGYSRNCGYLSKFRLSLPAGVAIMLGASRHLQILWWLRWARSPRFADGCVHLLFNLITILGIIFFAPLLVQLPGSFCRSWCGSPSC